MMIGDVDVGALGSTVLYFVDIVIRIVALFIVPRGRRPQTALAWLLGIFLIPWLGIILFVILGSSKLPRARRKKQAEIDNFIRHAVSDVDDSERLKDWSPWFRSAVHLNRELGAIPLASYNAAKLHPENDEALLAMTNAIDAAKQSVNVEFYILSLDETSAPFFDALERAHERGVTVRLLLDHLGNRQYPGWRRTVKRLDAIGFEWHVMLPFKPLHGKIQRPDLRNHRKLLVIDDRVAFMGSRNIIDPGYQRRRNHRKGLVWKDFMVEFEGQVVAAINAVFVTDWYSETDEFLPATVPQLPAVPGDLDCQVVPSGPGYAGENNLRLFITLVHAAQEKIIITSPYFVPDDAMLYAITTAAQRGIQVEMFVSEIGDQFLVHHAQRSYYGTLLRAGVRIWEYAAPTILHSKHMTIDDEISVVGSSNMDMRSFTLDLELSIMVRGGDFLERLRAVEEANRQHSRELTLVEWEKRSVFARSLDDLARLSSAVQ